MGRKSNATKIRELLATDHELIDYKDNGTDFGMCWMHKVTGKYFTSNADNILLRSRFLLDHNIDSQITHGLGFSSNASIWYGWSRRAICGFIIGSSIKKGDCAYVSDSIQNQIDAVNSFWIDDKYHTKTTTSIRFNKSENKNMLYTEWKYNNTIPNESLRDTISGVWTEIESSGKGEWTAKTLANAKLMAENFRDSVS